MFGSLTRPRVAALIAVGALAAGCATTTQTVPISYDTAPPPGFFRIMGVTLHDGMAISFVEPASIERNAEGAPVVVGQRETTYQGRPAKTGVQILVADIEKFWVIEETKAVTDSSGQVVGAVAGLVLVCLLTNDCDDS